ncbi:MAG: FtsQ-type POTRA domain-containing protein [Candidatus Limnocylindrales bacterium]
MTRGTPRRYRTAAGTPRRQPRVRRASAGLTPTRSAAVLAMLIAAGAIYGLSSTPAFGFGRLEVSGAMLTAEAAIRSTVGLADGTNLVGLATEPIAARLRQLPSIRAVDVSVELPDALKVSIEERRAIIIWKVGERRFAVDGDGLIFAETTDDPAGATSGTPVVSDERAASSGLAVAAVLDPVVLDAARRLGSLTPGQVGSHAAGVAVHVTDDRGFTLSSGKGGWTAVFGFYGRSQRTPALIPGQVQLLSGLLAGREDTVQTVILADDREGTYIAKPTPRPSTTPKP